LGGLKIFQILEANIARSDVFPVPSAETEGEHQVSVEQSEEVSFQFESRLRRIIRMGTEAGVKMIVSTVISNPLAPPSVLFCPQGLQNLGLPTRFLRPPSVQRITHAALEEQLQLFPECPDLLWVQGLLYERERRIHQVADVLDGLRDADRQPVRADRITNQIIRRTVEEEKGLLVDVNALVRDVGKGIEPAGIFEDAVHLRPDGQRVLAYAMAPVLSMALGATPSRLPTVHQAIIQSGAILPH